MTSPFWQKHSIRDVVPDHPDSQLPKKVDIDPSTTVPTYGVDKYLANTRETTQDEAMHEFSERQALERDSQARTRRKKP